MKNGSITINLEFYKIHKDVPCWLSHYRHNGKPFSITGLSRGKFLLEFPIGFMVQFKKHTIEQSMKLETLDEAMRIADMIYHGKAGEIEDSLPFDDYTNISLERWLKQVNKTDTMQKKAQD